MFPCKFFSGDDEYLLKLGRVLCVAFFGDFWAVGFGWSKDGEALLLRDWELVVCFVELFWRHSNGDGVSGDCLGSIFCLFFSEKGVRLWP